MLLDVLIEMNCTFFLFGLHDGKCITHHNCDVQMCDALGRSFEDYVVR